MEINRKQVQPLPKVTAKDFSFLKTSGKREFVSKDITFLSALCIRQYFHAQLHINPAIGGRGKLIFFL